VLMKRLRANIQTRLFLPAVLSASVLASSSRADFLSEGATDEGTRVTVGGAPPNVTHGALSMLNNSVDTPTQTTVDSDVEFALSAISTLPHGVVVNAATLSINVSGAHSGASAAKLSINGYPDGDGIIGLGDFLKPTTSLGRTATLLNAAPGSESLSFQFDVTSFLQVLADKGTKFVGFHLEGPSGDSSESIWGSAAVNPSVRPNLTIDFTANPVPEPSSLLLFASGAIGFVGYRRFRKSMPA
jgi:hypothetical protein